MATKYDIEKTAAAVVESLKHLRTTQQPGVRSAGTGSKMDVLQAAKDDIIKLMAEGYTAKQIAEAIMSGDAGFTILPKSITMLAGKPEQKMPKAPRRSKAKDTKQAADKPSDSRTEPVTTSDMPKSFPARRDEL